MAERSPLQERRAVGSAAKRFRFSLKTMLLVAVTIAILFALIGMQVRDYRQQHAIAAQFRPYCRRVQMENGAIVGLEMNKTPPKDLLKNTLPHLKRLQRFEVYSLTDDDASYLPGLDNLEFLDITSHQPTDDGLRHFGDVDSLIGFGVHSSQVTEMGLRELRRLRDLQGLSVLAVTGQSFSDYECVHSLRKLAITVPLADAALADTLLRFHNLESLHIVAEIDADFVSIATTLPRLKILGLRQRASIGDIVQSMSEESTLESLSVKGVPVTSAGAERLREIRTLQALGVRDDWLTPPARKVLEQTFIIRGDKHGWVATRRGQAARN